MGYDKISHTADLRLKVWGENYEALFYSAFLGMANELKSGDFKEEKRGPVRVLKVESSDITGLLVDFLSEVLYLSQTNREVYDKVNFKKLEDKTLEAEVSGIVVSGFGEDIKAVTYHEADVKKNKKGLYETSLVFDI